MSKLSSHCRIMGSVCGMVIVWTSLPSTLSVPVPGRPRPLILLKASVPRPRPSYLKSNSKVCLPVVSASGPSHLMRFRSMRFQRNTGFSLEQIESVAGKPSAGGQDHALRTARGDFDVRGDGVGAVEQHRGVALWQADHGLGIDELRAASRDVRARRDYAGGDRGVHRE